MSREKQIEEMAEIITSADPYVNCKGQPCSTCECQDIVHNCYSAKAIYNAGYRKSTDLAEEIFAEIDEAMLDHASGYIDDHWLYVRIAELKKKYIGGDINVLTKDTEGGE